MHEPRCEKQTSEEAKEKLKSIPECELRHVHFGETEQQKRKNTNIELRKERFRETMSSWKGPIQGMSSDHSETWDGPVEGVFMEEENWEYVVFEGSEFSIFNHFTLYVSIISLK